MKRCHSIGTIGVVATAAMLGGCSDGEFSAPLAQSREAAFLESGGQVAMEAEHFTGNLSQGAHNWILDTNASPSGGQAMLSSPDNGAANNTGYDTQSPRLDFQVSFSQTGTYHVWVRGRDSGATTGSGDSCHAGIDGIVTATADRISSFGSSFGWSKTTMDASAPATVNVTTTGLHTINLWMREDGFVADKLLLTTNTSFVPSGTGPSESGQSGCSPTTYEAETMFHSTGGSTTGGWNIWSNGYISTNHTFAAGATTLTVTAQGTIAAGVWPHMIVRVGGTQIGEATVNSTSWTTYPFTFTATAGTQEIRVEFDNDLNQGGEDRNLLVDKVVASCGAAAPTCTDNVKNGNETDIDCGGGTCGACIDGKTCLVNSDCQSNICSGTCQPSGGTPPYKNPSLPIPTRVADLLGRMTLDEKIGQMTQGEQGQTSTGQTGTLFLGSILSGADSWPGSHTATDWINLVNGHQQAALATRLGIPIIYGIDAVHGQAKVQGGTVFPHNIGIGATRDAALAQEIGVITAREMLLSGIPWTFAPALTVARDQRWGRAYESYGEDPALATLLSANITGLQGTNLANNVLATAKHFVGDGGAMWGTGANPGGTSIDRGNAQMSLAALRAIHLAPYLPAIATHHVGSVMASFSAFNGTRMHAEQNLLTNVLKGELAFSGFVISDWLAVNELPGTYNEKVRTAVNAGVDMFMEPGEFQNFINTLRTEVNASNVSQARINDAVSRILTKKFELGLFEVPFVNQRATGTIGAASHRATARQAVRESLVLLKNSGSILPLSPTTTVCVNGNGASNLTAQQGAWTLGWQGPQATMSGATTILQGIDAVADVVASGCQVGIRVLAEAPQSYAEWMGDNANPSHDGSGSCVGTQGCVVILLGGRPMNIQSLVNDANTRAIVMAWYPGSEGAGVADVLFGTAGANFTGKLPVTWKVDAVDTPVNYCDPAGPNTNGNGTPDACEDTGDHYSNPASPPASVLFPYGFGLSYGGGGPTCTDGTKNGAETDVDCGGGTCPDCVDGKICSINGDCTGNNCVTGTCCSILAAPTGLSAMPGNAQVTLSWNAVSGAEGYNVKRATVAGGPHTTVGSTAATSLVNGSLTNGTTYFYVASTVNTCGPVGTESANSSEVSATPNAIPTDMRAHYQFNETSGITAFDSSGNGLNATLQNGATFAAGYAGNGVRINGGTQRVALPTGIVQPCTDLTIAVRVNLVSNSTNWARIFDFGTGTATNMFLTPRGGAANILRFGFKLNNGTEQQISFTSTFPTAQWRHVAVTLSGNTGTLYLAGAQVAQNTSLSNNPNSMGATANNWLGDSQYTADPTLNGTLDDLRISCRAYSASEISAIASQ